MPPAEQDVVDAIAEGIKVIGDVAAVESKVAPYAAMLAGVLPFGGTVFGAIALAQPYIDQVAQYAPQVAAVVRSEGVPAIEAVRKVAPHVVDPLKRAYSILRAADPGLSNVTAADVTEAMLEAFVRPLFERNFFAPRDPRFDRADPAQVGG